LHFTETATLKNRKISEVKEKMASSYHFFPILGRDFASIFKKRKIIAFIECPVRQKTFTGISGLTKQKHAQLKVYK
jgi:hypothetical protein